MRKRNVDKHIWFSRAEAQELQRKAKKACLSEAGLISFVFSTITLKPLNIVTHISIKITTNSCFDFLVVRV